MVKIVAEIGVNHNGDMGMAIELIHCAASAGANACKFQTYDAEKLEPPGERRDMLKQYQLSWEDHGVLKGACDDARVEFMSTPFDAGSLYILINEFNMQTIKISSGGLRDNALLQAVAMSDRPVYLSTGMASQQMIAHALHLLGHKKSVVLMHCTSAYPTPDDDANLRGMIHKGSFFGSMVGLSDHTIGPVAPVMAVAMGAMVIEKHVTLDNTLDGPDHAMSADVIDFREICGLIRKAERMCGDGSIGMRDVEKDVAAIIDERRAHAE